MFYSRDEVVGTTLDFAEDFLNLVFPTKLKCFKEVSCVWLANTNLL